MLKKEFPKRVLNKVAECTELNQHTEALLIIGNQMREDFPKETWNTGFELGKLQYIQAESDRLSYTPWNALEVRKTIYNHIMSECQALYTNYKQIYMAT